MFIYKLSSWIDRYDPYWHSRLMALKATYLVSGLFIANMLLQPLIPGLVIALSAAGILLTEMPTINDLNKKDNLYLVYIILICISVGLFSSYAYFQGLFILVVVGWAYILYFSLRRKPELFQLISIVLMLAIISTEGFNSGNFFIILDTIKSILVFSLISFWLHKFFPNLYHKIWLSSILRSLEGMCIMLTLVPHDSQQVFKHILKANSSLALLIPRSYFSLAQNLTNLLSLYYYYLANLQQNQSIAKVELSLIIADLHKLANAIRIGIPLYSNSDHQQKPAPGYEILNKLEYTWNQLCEHVNS